MTPELFTLCLWLCLIGAVIGLIWAFGVVIISVALFCPPLWGPFAQWPTWREWRSLIADCGPIIGLLSAFCLTVLVASAWLQGVSQ
jgi:hypothetical protein